MNKGIGPTLSSPDLLPPSGDNLALFRPLKGEFKGYSSWRTLAIISLPSSSFCWVGNELHNVYMYMFGESMDITLGSRRKVPSEREAIEECKDALSPISNEMRIHPWWKVLGFLPCKFYPMVSSEDELTCHPRDRQKARKRGH